MGGVLDDIGDGFKDLGNTIEDGVNDGLGALEEGFDAGKKQVGHGVDWLSDKAGEQLDAHGMHGAAEVVRDAGDGLASKLGATPGELQLGQTEEANELIHGNPGRIRSSTAHLKDFQAAFEKVGQGMRKVDSSRWLGEGGNAFREKFGVHPTKWLHAADACEKAATALEAYAETVRWAQGEASEAIRMHREGKRASEEVKAALATAKDKETPEAKAAQARCEALLEAAETRLADARRQRNDAARDAEALVKQAMAHAPAEPPPLDRLGNTLADGAQAYATEYTHFVGGILKGTAGLVNFVRGLNPMDPYNLTHPAQYMQNASMTLSGLVSTVSHPDRTVTAVIDGFKKDPSEFLGRLVPELIGTKGTGLGRTGLRLAVKEGVESGASNLATRASKFRNFDDMGKRRTWNLFRSEESKIPVPPRTPGDHALISGDPVYFSKHTTTIGYDDRTMANLNRVAREPGKHDVFIHGTNRGVFLPGQMNSAGNVLMDFEVHPTHISDAIRSNPHYDGGPVRLISCHSGYADTAELPLAQSVANDLGVPVTAPTNRVGTDSLKGLDQTPEIGRNGYWRIFLPTLHGGSPPVVPVPD
ncbi:putative T7SS-secreted protein [Streptomyces sp. NPDC019396]|uniref:putative T7SS-secreted protein n=1 Tax=Streptomyces sp. NPDC019396 TaxID=3154687 RepID=UPI0033DAE960